MRRLDADSRNQIMVPKLMTLLIPGGMAHNTCFTCFDVQLHSAGYDTVPTRTADPLAQNLTAENDAQSVYTHSLKPLLDDGKDVIIYTYSYGGSVFGTDGPSFVKSERQRRGDSGGVVGIVYMSITTVPGGIGQLEFMGSIWPGFIAIDKPKARLITFDTIVPILINDAEAADAEAMATTVVAHSALTFDTPVLPPLWANRALDGKRSWLKAMMDACFPPRSVPELY